METAKIEEIRQVFSRKDGVYLRKETEGGSESGNRCYVLVIQFMSTGPNGYENKLT